MKLSQFPPCVHCSSSQWVPVTYENWLPNKKTRAELSLNLCLQGPVCDEKLMCLWDSVAGRQMTSCDTERRRREGELPGSGRRVIVLRRESPV